jgi:uncharacterized membrane protein
MRLELIHPMIVHFPIVLVLCLFALDAVATIRCQPILGRGGTADASTALAVAAGLTAIAAFEFGDRALDIARSVPNAPMGLLEMHEECGTFTAFAIAAWSLVRAFLWWRRTAPSGGLRTGAIVVEAALAAAILATAWYGGELVYNNGVAVASFAG